MNLRDYYGNVFPNDLDLFLQGSPFFGRKWKRTCRTLERVPVENREMFLLCLYNIVLFDQAMHFHFRLLYQRFEELTHFPKFCHGEGVIHHNPNRILSCPQYSSLIKVELLRNLLPEGTELLVGQVSQFLRNSFPEITAKEFFEKLLYHDKSFGSIQCWRKQSEWANELGQEWSNKYANWAAYDELRKTVEEAKFQ